MRKPARIRVEKPDTMECRACGATMRLFGIEAHPAIAGIRLRTYCVPAAITCKPRPRPCPPGGRQGR